MLLKFVGIIYNIKNADVFIKEDLSHFKIVQATDISSEDKEWLSTVELLEEIVETANYMKEEL